MSSQSSNTSDIDRRRFLQTGVAAGVATGFGGIDPILAQSRAETLLVVQELGPNSLDMQGVGSNQTVKQFVWGKGYIDELVQTSINSNPTAQSICDTPYWACQDANWNVLGLVDSTGTLTERYEYTAYGQRLVFISAGTNDPSPEMRAASKQTPANWARPASSCWSCSVKRLKNVICVCMSVSVFEAASTSTNENEPILYMAASREPMTALW